jgi:hypothetical protein
MGFGRALVSIIGLPLRPWYASRRHAQRGSHGQSCGPFSFAPLLFSALMPGAIIAGSKVNRANSTIGFEGGIQRATDPFNRLSRWAGERLPRNAGPALRHRDACLRAAAYCKPAAFRLYRRLWRRQRAFAAWPILLEALQEINRSIGCFLLFWVSSSRVAAVASYHDGRVDTPAQSWRNES